jgi:hypothetical protein
MQGCVGVRDVRVVRTKYLQPVGQYLLVRGGSPGRIAGLSTRAGRRNGQRGAEAT